jgi:hypothetical protein
MDEHTSHELAYKKGYEQGKQDAMKWIPVTEQLPEPLVDVLSYSGHKTLFEVDCVDETGRWYSGYFSEYPVTHWMPLPSPPSMEESK